MSLVINRALGMARALITSIEADPGATPTVRAVARWVRRFLCAPKPKQCVVGNRRLHAGGDVTQAQFIANDPVAHVCPFVQAAIDQDSVWIEEHAETSELDIRALMAHQIADFKAAHPPYDPVLLGMPAGVPALNKTFINVFANVRHAGGTCPEIQTVQSALKPRFVAEGMMLGEFFHGCPQEGLYNAQFRPLVSMYPMLATRYLVEDDKLFNHADPILWTHHRRYFPNATWP